MQNFRLFSLLFIFIVGCGKSLPEIEGFDATAFKNDRNGCKGDRVASEEILIRDKQQLLALTEMQIVRVLGRPDQNEIYKRNQKFYTYFIQPAPKCNGDSLKVSKKLIVRFNAMGLAKEIVVD
jgi:hypothetical protein